MSLTGPSSIPEGFPTALTGRIQAIVDAALSIVPRAVRLPEMLEAQLLQVQGAGLLRAVQDMHHAVGQAQPEAPPSLWRRSWPFRTRQSAQLQRGRFEEALATQAPVVDRLQAVRSAHLAQQATARHSLQRLERTRAELDPRVRQAQELLAELWEVLRPQRPDPDDSATLQQLRILLAEVDRYRVALQRMEGVCAGAADVLRLAGLVADGRDEVLELLGPPVVALWARWQAQVGPLLQDDQAPQDILAGAEPAQAASAALLQHADRARVACTRLQIDEQALAHALATLREQLAPFAR